MSAGLRSQKSCGRNLRALPWQAVLCGWLGEGRPVGELKFLRLAFARLKNAVSFLEPQETVRLVYEDIFNDFQVYLEA